MKTGEKTRSPTTGPRRFRAVAVTIVVLAEGLFATAAFGWLRQLSRGGPERAVNLAVRAGDVGTPHSRLIRVSRRQALTGFRQFRFTRRLTLAGRGMALPQGIAALGIGRDSERVPSGASLRFTMVGRKRSAVVVFPLGQGPATAGPSPTYGRASAGSLEIFWVPKLHGAKAEDGRLQLKAPSRIRPFSLYAPAWATQIKIQRIRKSGFRLPLAIFLVNSAHASSGVHFAGPVYLFVGHPQLLPRTAAGTWVRRRLADALALAGAPPWTLEPLVERAYATCGQMADERWLDLALGIGSLPRSHRAARMLAGIAYFRRCGQPFGRIFLFQRRGLKLYLCVSEGGGQVTPQSFFLFDLHGLLVEWGQISITRPAWRFQGIGLAAGLCGFLQRSRGDVRTLGAVPSRRR